VPRYFAALSLCLVLNLGCEPRDAPENGIEVQSTAAAPNASPEAGWSEQIRQVQDGRSDSIRTTQSVTESNQFDDLKSLTNLRELVLDAGVVRDEDLGRFIEQVNLTHLRLRESPLTDAAAKRIASSQHNLKILNVPQCVFGTDGVSALSDLKSLTHLRLGGSKIDDSCVASISKIESLQSLHLIGPKITGQSLRNILQMKNLESFYLDDCNIPSKDWEEFFQARKDIHVHLDQMHHDRDPGRHTH
jgi:hypothetical protein